MFCKTIKLFTRSTFGFKWFSSKPRPAVYAPSVTEKMYFKHFLKLQGSFYISIMTGIMKECLLTLVKVY